MAGGDARRIITAIEFIVESGNKITIDTCKQVMPTKFSTIDKKQLFMIVSLPYRALFKLVMWMVLFSGLDKS